MTSEERLKMLRELVEARISHESRIMGAGLFGNFAAVGLLASMSKDFPLRHSVFGFLALLVFLIGIVLGAFTVGWRSEEANNSRVEIIRLADQEITSDQAVKVYEFGELRTALSMLVSCCALFFGVLLCLIGLALN
jgi:hypothetical protein